MRLFHGSCTEVVKPLVGIGRAFVDFGKGFYLTILQDQAESWAKTISGRRPGQTPVLNVYDFDIESCKKEGYRHRFFETYDMEWLDYVVDSRHGGSKSSEYDVVEGGVANDKVIDTVEDYENGVITAEQALGQLAYQKLNHQLCILNQEVADKFLVFIRSEGIYR
ncbi:MAG: DUF3990 domain-containing protein [Kiritimatiellae bacterium]|nr:DUF3990 domain-containing protein [Kiritimatiellia bacterium]